MRIPDFTVSAFGGLNTFIKDTKTLKPGIATSSTELAYGKYGDHIELRRGTLLLGQTRASGAGKITGLGVALRADGEQVPFWSRGRKLEYYDALTDDRAEVGSDLLPAAASGEESGSRHTRTSRVPCNMPARRIPASTRSPSLIPEALSTSQSHNYRWGILRFGQGRALAGRRNGTTAGNKDLTGAYLSHIDRAVLDTTEPFASRSRTRT